MINTVHEQAQIKREQILTTYLVQIASSLASHEAYTPLLPAFQMQPCQIFVLCASRDAQLPAMGQMTGLFLKPV